MEARDEKARKARELSWKALGKNITFFLPGMFCCNGVYGKYPALSITGSDCALQCEHCRATLLETMIAAPTPELLVEKCLRLAGMGNHGVLISGGCDERGQLPWGRFIPAIRKIKERSNLFLSIHCGLVDDQQAQQLREAGVDQALIDVIGHDETYQAIYHVDFGVSRILDSLGSLNKVGLTVVPHVVCGIHYGRMKGERRAIRIISHFDVEQMVIVSLMNTRRTPLWNAATPKAEDVADIIAEAKLTMPAIPVSMGCARERGNLEMELLAIDAGINRMALPSEEAIKRAEAYGLQIQYQKTCCSLPGSFPCETWQ
jgi:uncharacterized radical SAM superfamily protein